MRKSLNRSLAANGACDQSFSLDEIFIEGLGPMHLPLSLSRASLQCPATAASNFLTPHRSHIDTCMGRAYLLPILDK
jgi:hypothetical protein